MVERYNHIQTKLKEARETGDMKKIRTWRNKLEKWQQAYGAYAPVTSSTFHRYE